MAANLQKKISKVQNFTGAAVATLTPFDHSGNINVEPIEGYIKHLKANGVEGLYVHGTTGEGFSLTNPEKLILAKAYKAAIAKHYPEMLFILNITSTCMKETLELARDLEVLGGIDAFALLPPLFFKVSSPQGLVDYMKLVGNAAPNTPLLYYYIPSFVTENVNIVEALKLGVEQIPQLVGMKYSSPDIITFGLIHEGVKNFKIFCGFEDVLLSALVTFNCQAAVGAIFSLPGYGKRYRNMLDNVSKNLELCRKEQAALTSGCGELRKDGKFFSALKEKVNQEFVQSGNPNINFGYTRSPIDFKYSF